MRLAEALMERADMKKKILQLSERMITNAKVFEDEEPLEDPEKLMHELDRVIGRYESLISKINVANATNRASNGEVIADLIARREAYLSKEKALKDMLGSLKPERSSYYCSTKDERRTKVVIDVPSIRKQTDDLAKRIRETDTLIQEANWMITID